MRRLTVLLPVISAFLVGAAPASAWTWPVEGPVLQEFSVGSDPYAGGQHRGVDIAAAAGAAVRAPVAGLVSFAGTVPRGGLAITIHTVDGYAVTLVHLGALAVTKGVSVAEGAVVGAVGPSGVPEHPVPYLHLGVRVAADENGYVDPLGLLPGRQAEAGGSADAEPVSGTAAAEAEEPPSEPVPPLAASAPPVPAGDGHDAVSDPPEPVPAPAAAASVPEPPGPPLTTPEPAVASGPVAAPAAGGSAAASPPPPGQVAEPPAGAGQSGEDSGGEPPVQPAEVPGAGGSGASAGDGALRAAVGVAGDVGEPSRAGAAEQASGGDASSGTGHAADRALRGTASLAGQAAPETVRPSRRASPSPDARGAAVGPSSGPEPGGTRGSTAGLWLTAAGAALAGATLLLALGPGRGRGVRRIPAGRRPSAPAVDVSPRSEAPPSVGEPEPRATACATSQGGRAAPTRLAALDDLAMAA